MLDEYRQHVKERADLGIVPEPLNAEQTAALVDLIKKHEIELREALETVEYQTVHKALNNCQGVDIDVKLRKEAEVLHLKL